LIDPRHLPSGALVRGPPVVLPHGGGGVSPPSYYGFDEHPNSTRGR
jgi:hypothetical protein